MKHWQLYWLTVTGGGSLGHVQYNTVEVEMFAFQNVCEFSNPEFFANRNYLRFFNV